MKHLIFAPFLLGFISPVFADIWKDIQDLTKLIESHQIETKQKYKSIEDFIMDLDLDVDEINFLLKK